jgi:endonuclease YncB( thermonuclease family)
VRIVRDGGYASIYPQPASGTGPFEQGIGNRWFSWRGALLIGMSVVAILLSIVIGFLAFKGDAAAAVSARYAANFQICSLVRFSCVVDGDTFWLEGRKIRVADIDTPEITRSKCPAEYRLGMQATYRFRDLLNAGPFELRTLPGRSIDRYGRELRVVLRSGRSIGDLLVKEGLARVWLGRREPWCRL